MPTSRTYPHVPSVKDRDAASSLRLLWDRLFSVEDAVTAANTTIAAQATTIAEQAVTIMDLQRKVARVSISPTTAAGAADSDVGLDIADARVISGPFPTGPTAITFPGIGVVQVYSSPDVSGWTQTGTITRLAMTPGQWHVGYSTMAAWLPGVIIGPGTLQEATIWLFLEILGVWTGAGAERLRPNQVLKLEPQLYSDWPRNLWYDATRWGPLATFTPVAGANAAVLITAGSTRVDNQTLYTERTNLVQFTWPADGESVTIV